MKLTLLISYFLLHSILGAELPPISGPICIIGGGISGLTIANLLQDRGHRDVHLYEAETRPGGKIATFRAKLPSGEVIRMEQGPIVFSRLMHYTVKYLAKYNMTTVPYDIHDQALFNPRSGVIYPKLEFSSVLESSIRAASDKYKVVWAESTKNGSLLYMGYLELTSNSSASQLIDLSTPIQTWLEERGLSLLIPLFSVILTALGYGDVKDIPALYALKSVVAEDAEAFFKIGDTSHTVQEGFDVWVDRISAGVKNKWVGWKAVDINRNLESANKPQTVMFKVQGRKSLVPVQCGRTILAFPPLLVNLAVMISDLSHREKQILNQVKISKYAASGVHIPNLKRVVYSGLVPEIGLDYNRHEFPKFDLPHGDGGVVILTIQDKGSQPQGYYNAYSWIYGDYSDQANEKDVEIMSEKVNATIKKIHPFSKSFFTRATEYFPHVTSKSLRDGFYKDFNEIQGVGGLYYATTLLTLESMNNALEMAEKFVEKYF